MSREQGRHEDKGKKKDKDKKDKDIDKEESMGIEIKKERTKNQKKVRRKGGKRNKIKGCDEVRR